MSDAWKTVPLGDVVEHRKEFIRIDDMAEYKRCRVQLHVKGIVLRDTIPGASIKTKKQQVCKAGEFLVAEIDAKVGGFGIVPEELDEAIVSSHYFLFAVDEARLDRQFLGYFIKTPAFREQVNAQGSTNYAAIRPSHVLEYTIPLPPLPEQRRIVAKIDQLAQRIDEAKGLRGVAAAEGAALRKAASRTTFGDQQPDWLPLGELVQDIVNGWSPACLPTPAPEGSWGVIKVGAVSFGRFDATENKELPIGLPPKPQYEIKSGDFLMSRANTTELVGACALVGYTRTRLILCDKVFRFIFFDKSPILPSYLDHALKSPALRKQIESAATGTSPTMKNISKAKILQLRLPVPDLKEQERVVRHLDVLRDANTSLKREQRKRPS